MDRWLGITRYAARTLHTVSSVCCRLAAEAREVDDEERGDMVRPLAERALPEAGLPEAEAARRLVGVGCAEGCHRHGRALHVEVGQLAHILQPVGR